MADAKKAVLANILEARPLVLVVQSSPGADALAHKNGLTVADLFRPFADMKEQTVPFRTNNAAYSLRGFRMRVLPASELGCPPWDASEAHLSRATSAEVAGKLSAADMGDIPLGSIDEYGRWLGRLKGCDPAPWSAAYRRGLASTLRCLPQEQTECPAAILTVISTSDPDPLGALNSLCAPGALPRPYGADQYDPTWPGALHRVVVVLSDKAAEREKGLNARNLPAALADGMTASPAFVAAAGGAPYISRLHGRALSMEGKAILSELKVRWPANALFGVFINSNGTVEVLSGTLPPVPDVWSLHMSEPLVGGREAGAEALLALALVPVRGACMSEGDVTSVRDMTARIITTSILPALEARVFTLQGSVGKIRAGLRGKIMSFMGSSGGGAGAGAGGRGGAGGAGAESAPRGLAGAAAGLGFAVADRALSVGSSFLGMGGGGAAGASGSAPGSSSAAAGAGFDEGPSGSGAPLLSDVGTVTYPWGSPYAQTRLLADLLLAVGDGEGAAALFRALREEARSDKAAAHFGAASEGYALAALVRDREGPPGVPHREAEAAFEAAASAYYRAAAAGGGGGSSTLSLLGSPGGAPPPLPASEPGSPVIPVTRRIAFRMATRAVFACAELLVGSSSLMIASALGGGERGGRGDATSAVATIASANARIRDAAVLLRRAALAEGDGLAAAVLTEAAGLACLRMHPPSMRRAAAHLSVAGLHYGVAGPSFARLAVRCLVAAASAVGESPLSLPTRRSTLSSPPPWALISDHLCLHVAQQLLVVGRAEATEGAAAALFTALVNSAVRLPPTMQRNMVRELVRAASTSQVAKRAASVRAALERWAKKGSVALPEGFTQRLGESGSDVAALLASLSNLPPGDAAKMVGDAERSAELVCPGLPLLHDGSVQVLSWGNAESAAAALAQACASAEPAMGGSGAGDAAAAPPPPYAAFGLASTAIAAAAAQWDPMTRVRLNGFGSSWATEAAALAPTCSLLLALGSGEGCTGEGLWAGHLPGEGPVRAGESSSASGRPPWTRMAEAWVRDVKAAEKGATTGVAGFVTAPGAAAASSGIPPDWRAMCVEIARAAEDEAEGATKSHRSARAAWAGPSAWSAETAGVAAGLLDAAPASSLARLLGTGEGWTSVDGPACEGEEASMDTGAEGAPPTGPIAAALLSASASIARVGASRPTGGPTAAGPPLSVRAPRLLSPTSQPLYHAADVVSKATDRFIGEPLGVVVTLSNPTGVDLALGGVRLIGDVKGEGGAEVRGEGGGPAGRGWAVAPSGPGLTILALDVVLAPGEARPIHLLAIPTAAGTLTIKGVAWTLLAGPRTPPASFPALLAGGPSCRHDFELIGPPLNDNKANKTAGARAVDRRLEARVKGAREWAGLRVEGLGGGTGGAAWTDAGLGGGGEGVDTQQLLGRAPGSGGNAPPLPLHLPLAASLSLWEGQVLPVSFSLTNAGVEPLAFACVRATGGGAVIVAPDCGGLLDGLDGATLPLSWEDALVRGGALVAAASGTGYALPPGATATWPLLLRPTRPGCHVLRLLLLYSSTPREGLKARELGRGPTGLVRATRWTARVRVLPALAALAALSPSPSAAGSYDLHVRLANVAPPSAPVPGGIAPVSLPLTMGPLSLLTDGWTATLTAVSSSSLLPGGPAPVPAESSVPLTVLAAAPLPFLTCRTLAYTLTSRLPQPTALMAPCGTLLPLTAAQLSPRAPPTPLAGLASGQCTLLRTDHAQATIREAIRFARAAEHARRVAAEAADALPPSLRSIRKAKERAGGEGRNGEGDGEGDGEGEEEDDESLPSSAPVLSSGRVKVGLVLPWTRPSSLLSATVAGGAEGGHAGYLYIAGLAAEAGRRRAAAGSVSRPLLMQLSAAASAGTGAPSTSAAPLPLSPSRSSPRLPLVASLALEWGKVGAVGEAPALLTLYNTGPPGSLALSLDLALDTRGEDGLDGPGLGPGQRIARAALARSAAWAGPSLRSLPPLRPGHRLVLTLTALVGGGRGGTAADVSAGMRVRARQGEGPQPDSGAAWLPLLPSAPAT
jgi:hypothetical protein